MIKTFLKKTAAALTIAAITLTSLGTAVFAADDNLDFNFDFEDWSCNYGSGNSPSGWRFKNENTAKFESGTDSETGSNVARCYTVSSLILKLGKYINSGNLHLSFDVKFEITDESAAEKLLYVGFYTDKDTNTDINSFATSNARCLWLYPSKLTYARDTVTSWSEVNSGKVPGGNVWHKIDVVFEEMSTPETSNLYIYMDGEIVNRDAPIKFGDLGALKGIFFTTENAKGGSATKVNPVLIDNVKLYQFYGSKRLCFDLDKTKNVPTSDAELTATFKETVDTEAIKPSDIKIVRLYDNKSIPNISITQRTSDSVTFKVNEQLEPEVYQMSFAPTVVGKIYNMPSEPITFVTASDDGKEHLFLTGAKIIGYDGAEYDFNTDISSASRYIRLEFSEPIADDINQNVLLSANGETVGYDYDLSDDNQTLTIEPSGLLKPNSDYVLRLMPTLAHMTKPDVVTGKEYVKTFKTKNDGMCIVASDELIQSGGEIGYSASFIKTDNSERYYTLIIAEYENVTNTEGKTYKKLAGMSYCPIGLLSDDRGYITCDTEKIMMTGEGREYKAFLLSYPDGFVESKKIK